MKKEPLMLKFTCQRRDFWEKKYHEKLVWSKNIPFYHAHAFTTVNEKISA